MSAFLEFMENHRANDNARLHTAVLAEIITYDPVLMQADLQPLINDKEVEYAPILNAYVSCIRAGGFIIRPPYKPGDIVIAVIIERGIDGVFTTGTKSDQHGKRRHNLADAVVVGSFTAKPNPMPEEHGEDLLISTENGLNKIVLDIDGNITVFNQGTIDIRSTGDIAIRSDGTVKIDGEQILLNEGDSED